jgi:hypothetical protein
MFFQTVFVSLLLILMGLALCFAGYRFFVIILPIWGFFAGFQLGTGIMTWIGFSPGFLPFLVGLVFALGIAALAIFLRLPKLLVIVLTALGGAGTILAGFFLALGRVSLDSLQFSQIGAILRDSWLWGLIFLVIAALGLYFQWRTTQTFFVEEYSTQMAFASAGTDAAVAESTTSDATTASAPEAPDLTPPSSVTPAPDLPPATA